MEKVLEAKERAERNLKIADHMAFVTYSLIKDNKLLPAIIENVFLAFTNSVAALLYYERYQKNIPPFHDNFESKMHLFKSYCVPKYKFNEEYVGIMIDLKDLIMQHRASPVEFVKDNKLVICSDTYQMRTVTLETVKKHISKAKLFIQEVGNIISSKN